MINNETTGVEEIFSEKNSFYPDELSAIGLLLFVFGLSLSSWMMLYAA